MSTKSRDMPTKISNRMTYEDIEKRRVFFFHREALNIRLFALLKKYTDATGIKFAIEHLNNFVVIRKVDNR
eukprot:SAG11_NODE_6097_length_1388_cov_2.933282_1_plen_71_part_00